jgi:hypothetical protein
VQLLLILQESSRAQLLLALSPRAQPKPWTSLNGSFLERHYPHLQILMRGLRPTEPSLAQLTFSNWSFSEW